ncbi:MAG: histidine kinase, partial [Bacillota bacterium]
MKKEMERDSPSLRQLFLRLILFRLYLPLLMVGLAVIVGAAYLSEKNLEIQQQQIAESMAQVIDYHIDHGSRILDAVAKTAEIAEMEDLNIFMKSTWAAYGYFETLYYLDDKNKLIQMFPSNFRYSGLDMSNFPDFKLNGEE